jgi:hypothetical protein
MRDVLASNLGSVTGYVAGEGFHGFPQFLQ